MSNYSGRDLHCLWFALCVFSLIAGISSPFTQAQQTEPAHFSSDAKTLYAASMPANPPESDVVVLEDEETYLFDTNGKAVHTTYVRYKILTAKGVEGWDSVSAAWEPWHDDEPAIRARVITPDGLEHPLDPHAITNSPATDDQDRIYGDRRILRAPLPAVAAGSLIEAETTTHEGPVIPGVGMVYRDFFGRAVPVEHSRLILDAPDSLPLHYLMFLLPNLQPQKTEEGRRVHVTFDYGPQPGLDAADNELPSDVAPYPEVMFSTGDSWAKLANDYGNTVDSRIATSDVKNPVNQLVSGKTTRDEKVAAILQYLSTEIRYTGIEFGDNAVLPRSPNEVLEQKYGDCKDKSVLLVAMLRATGIGAYLALLDVGESQDVPSDLVGMGLFDHAIVYVPGTPDLWIDATDEYARLGELPASDQGRWALVIRPESDKLVRTAVSTAEDNILIEQREFHLAENGPASVVEISQPHGDLESAYRYDYGDDQNKDAKDNLTKYVKSMYLAEKLDKIGHSDARNLSKPFELSLTCDRAGRGATDLDSAVVAIRLERIFGRLPDDLQTTDSGQSTGSDSSADKPKKTRTADYQLAEPFITEWRYQIVPPPGFQPKGMPQSNEFPLGPATLTENFKADSDYSVHAVIRFELHNSRVTAAQATEMRKDITDIIQGQPIFIYFEPLAEALANEGKFPEAFRAYHNLIASNPKDPIHHLQLANALLNARLGEAARQEARLATQLDPQSWIAQATLGDILEHDLVGRKFRPGSDYAGAETALRAAAKLDTDDKTNIGNLAIMLEFNKWGLRYGPGAKLDEAIATYQSLSKEQLANMNLQTNLAITQFYARKFSDALKTIQDLNPQPAALAVACVAALNGSQSALQEARKRTGTEDQFRDAVKNAGQLMENLRMYSLAADLFGAGASGDSASDTMADAARLRAMQRHEDIVFAEDPKGVATHFALYEMDPDLTLDELRAITSRNGSLAIATPENVESYDKEQQALVSRKARSGTFADTGVDTALANAHPVVQGDDTTGYKVTLWPSASYRKSVYIVKEDGKYKVLGTSRKAAALGLEVLDRLAKNDLHGAQALLDWLRDDWHLVGGDDPLAGESFPRFWNRGQNPEPAAMKLAAASILVTSKDTSTEGLAILEAASKLAENDIERQNILLAELEGYNYLQKYDKALANCVELAKQYPESKRIFSNESFDLAALGRFSEGDSLARDRLNRIPGDIDAQRALEVDAVAQDNYNLAHELGLKVIASENAQASDFNEVAWLSLFTGKTGKDDLSYAIKAAQISDNSFAELHTLASVYAELGDPRKAGELLVQAMDQADLNEPDTESWYLLGRIAEAYGEVDIGAADYHRVEKPKLPLPFNLATSTFKLAQLHLKTLQSMAKLSARQ